ncbi:MerR family transcriptional regulator [Macrococcus bovicus]|nr:MerR family transcriptional regulator [Macrococcus bovicus]
MKEFVELTGLSEHTLRYYEKEGLFKVDRLGNNRVFSEENKLWIESITHLKETGMTIADIKVFCDLGHIGDSTIAERLSLLINHRQAVIAQMQKLQEGLDFLDYKIHLYEGNIDQCFQEKKEGNNDAGK